MVEMIQRLTAYAIKEGVTNANVKTIIEIDGVDSAAERDLSKAVWRALDDKTLNKITIRRTYVPEDQGT